MRYVFFSFHYEQDVWRANQVRNSWVTQGGKKDAGFVDAAEFESIERQGEANVKRWIREQLEGTSVTVVLIGEETADRPLIQYEIEKSIEIGNGLVGVYIHNLGDQNGLITPRGQNPLNYYYKTYDYKDDDGYNYLGDWIEEAARNAGR